MRTVERTGAASRLTDAMGGSIESLERRTILAARHNPDEVATTQYDRIKKIGNPIAHLVSDGMLV
jgi:hypothetical protein